MVAVLSQTPTSTVDSVPAQAAPELSPAERAAIAAERSAAAAEKTAALVQKMAEANGWVPPAPAPGAEEKKDVWAGSVGLSLISLTGNTDAITLATHAAADRKWTNWTLGLRLNGAYGQTQGAEGVAPTVVALRASGSVRGDRAFGKIVSLFALTGVDTDHVKSIEYRWVGEVGTGLTFVNKKVGEKDKELEVMFLRLDLAGRFAHESRYQYYPDPLVLGTVQLVAPRLGIVFRYAVNKGIRFSEEAEVMPNLFGATAGKRVLVNSTTKLAAQMTESVSMNASFLVTSDSVPAAGKKPVDTALTVGLEAAF
jgi:putative salt-induced outer membrane protein YdiY